MSAIAPLQTPHTPGEPQPGDAFVHRHGVTCDDSRFTACGGIRYEALPASEVLSGIDTDELVTFLGETSTSGAIRKYRAALQAR